MAPEHAQVRRVARRIPAAKHTLVPWRARSWEIFPCVRSLFLLFDGKLRISSSVVVDHLDDRVKLGGGGLLYFYFDYKRQLEQTPFNILVTLLRQLLSTHSNFPNAASDLYKRIQKGQGLPAWRDLMKAFRNICTGFSEELFLVFDALDECDEKAHREPILDLLEFMSKSNVRVLVTSRPYPPDINDAFANYPQIVIEAADADIRAFLLEKITKCRWKISRFIDEALRQEIIQLITAKSQGMYVLP